MLTRLSLLIIVILLFVLFGLTLRRALLVQILTEIDGVGAKKSVFVIRATTDVIIIISNNSNIIIRFLFYAYSAELRPLCSDPDRD